ncbi:MAG TPA: GC-type dockerin domain-anchored protein, partial [Phycisphaerales bacterium]|nr:GC-type dockerin domain-anchored protein [Phycisphaerales bacterium]
YRFADDFVVPAGAGIVWSLSEVVVYAYSTDGGSSPFAGANLRIWNGAPGTPGAAVVFGDTTTDRLASATLTPMLRTASTAPLANAPSPAAPDQSRPVWALTLQLSPPLGLAAGTYWLDWQLDVEPLASAFCPPVTLTGQRAKPGAASNALQFRTALPPLLDGDWLPLVDTGKPAPAPDVVQDLPFILRGAAGTPACGPADVGGTGGVPGQDGVLDNNDFVVFIDWFFAQLPAADRGVTGGIPGSDSAWDNNDFVVFIDQFFGGC